MHGSHRNKHRHLLSSVAAISLLAITSTSVFAQGHTISAAGSIWDGFYVGVHIGAGKGDIRVTDLHDGNGSVNTTPSGVVGGANIGFNRMVNGFLLGLEADISVTDWKESTVFPTNSSRQASTKINLLSSLRIRLGLPMDQTLFYVTGGLAYADANYVHISPGGTLSSGNHNKFGGVLGLGVDYKLPNQNISARLESLYYVFGDKASFGSDNPGGKTKFKDALVVRLGLNYQFSDSHLKRDIESIGSLANGLTLYKYRYLWSDQFYVGVMAEEVCEIVPDAVIFGEDGYFRVNYALIGHRLVTWQQWERSQELAFAA